MSAAKPPIAIRITRPYQTEDEFLAHELDTISRTGVTLVGAQQRPEGTVLRFELALASGTPLLRGEGRVVGYKAAALGSEPGLSLRFTRLDSKSKALVDRVGAVRTAKRSMPPPGAAVSRPRSIPPPLPPAAKRSVRPAPPSGDSPEAAPEISVSTADVMVAAELAVAVPASVSVSVPVSASVSASVPVSVSAPDREAALGRLRERGLDPDRIARILSEGASRRSSR